MREQNRSEEHVPEAEEPAVRRWTILEILGLLVSALLVAAPLLSLAYSFLFPARAPAFAPTPTSIPTPTGGPTLPPTDTPTPLPTPIPTETPTPGPTPPPTETPTPGPTLPPTETPTPGPTETPAPTPVPTTPAPAQLTVSKVADRESAYPGDPVVFSIGLSNSGGAPASVTVDDTVPAQLALQGVWHTCSGGSIEYPAPGRFIARDLGVPAGQSCQIVVATQVVEGCNCSVVNRADWSAPGVGSGSASSQPVFLYGGPTATATPTWPPTPGPTATPTTAPTATPTWTPSPGPSATPTPTALPGTPAPTPRPRTPRPGASPTPTTPCARAVVSGQVCAAGVLVRISSCCPPWSASTTSDAQGRFAFAALTAGTYTVEAQGRSRTVTLPGCDSRVQVDLCPVTTPAATAPPAPTALEATATVSTPVEATQPPFAADVTLQVEAEPRGAQPGRGVRFRFTLHNWREARSLDDIVVTCTFSESLELQGAFSPLGVPRVKGQELTLQVRRLAAGQALPFQVDALVRPEVSPGTRIPVQAVAQAAGGVVVRSNVLWFEVLGEGTPLPEATPRPATPGVGGIGPEVLPTPGPGATGGQMPYTGSGLPAIGMLLGGVVLLSRQLRLRRARR